jgi:hypothetical protein
MTAREPTDESRHESTGGEQQPIGKVNCGTDWGGADVQVGGGVGPSGDWVVTLRIEVDGAVADVELPPEIATEVAGEIEAEAARNE